ncbi:MAG TPA: sigma-70 family RNA polymerase sigma factor [Thermoleophilaceae bacterium]|jgi:RNA polymerase sigma factor (sigma-70 family)
MTPRQLIEPARLAGTALLHTQTDGRLVDLARAGNDRAFEAIVSRYRKPLLRYCTGLLPPERAEDAVQQAFLNAYRALTMGEGEMNLKPWLYRIAHNASLNLLRQNGWTYDQIPEDFDGVQQPPQAVEQKERIREVVRSVKKLPERQRNAMVLRELEGRSYEEIALALGVTGGSVRQLLNRARTTLRDAATSLTPPDLVARLAERGAANEPMAARIAELSMGAGAAVTLAKVSTALVVAGAVAGGVTAGPLSHSSRDGTASAAEAPAAARGDADDGLGEALEKGLAAVGLEDRRGRAGERSRGRRGGGRRHAGDRVSQLDHLFGHEDHRGFGGGSGDRRAGPGGGDDRFGGDRSGPGPGGDGSHSGPGGGEVSGGSGDSSGPGGGGDGSSSGPGSGGGSLDGGSSGSFDSSGSGSSGSGSFNSGSGSGDSGSGSGSSGSGSGSDGSGDGTSLAAVPPSADSSGPH